MVWDPVSLRLDCWYIIEQSDRRDIELFYVRRVPSVRLPNEPTHTRGVKAPPVWPATVSIRPIPLQKAGSLRRRLEARERVDHQ